MALLICGRLPRGMISTSLPLAGLPMMTGWGWGWESTPSLDSGFSDGSISPRLTVSVTWGRGKERTPRKHDTKRRKELTPLILLHTEA